MTKFKNSKAKLLAIFGSFCFILSCQNDLELLEVKDSSYLEKTSNFSRTAKKLRNPYTVENMRKAFKKLKEKGLNKSSPNAGRIMEAFDIETSHLYVMYEPETIEEEAEIKQDSTLILADYPLDYDFTQEELDARPALTEGEIPEYYTAIRIDSEQASDDSYILMDELYIPEEDPYFDGIYPSIAKTTNPNVINNKEDLLRHLLYEAYKLTGNEAELEQVPLESGRWIFGSKWWPSGTIMVYDEIAGANKPVTGTKILIRQWFTVRQAITNGSGYFSTASVRGSARYVIQWEGYNYSIRNGSFFQAETRGPVKKNEAWNHTITGGDDKYHTLIHQAANDYYYGTRFGLTSPPRNGTWKKQMKIAAREINGKSSTVKAREIWTGAQISIKVWGHQPDKVYGTTIHELAHAAHREVDASSYNNVLYDAYTNPCISGGGDCHNLGPTADNNRRLLETWPTTVEILFVLDRYKIKFGLSNYNVYTYNRLNNLQYQETYKERYYTSAGYDMLDNYNQRVLGYNYPIDRVNGYTINQLEQALVGAKSWWQWRENIKKKYDNPTEIYLDELFNNWEYL